MLAPGYSLKRFAGPSPPIWSFLTGSLYTPTTIRRVRRDFSPSPVRVSTRSRLPLFPLMEATAVTSFRIAAGCGVAFSPRLFPRLLPPVVAVLQRGKEKLALIFLFEAAIPCRKVVEKENA